MRKFINYYLLFLLLFPFILFSNPTNENVTHGTCSFDRDGNSLNISQQTDKAIIQWGDFSINENEITKFIQPDSNSAVLNRVISTNPSSIYGQLEANGHIFLINQNGILIGPNGHIKSAGFIASTLQFSDDDFLNNQDKTFSSESPAKILNEGTIESIGNVYLISKEIENRGTISSNDTVNILAGSEIILYKDNKTPSVKVSGEGKIDQKGLIQSVQANLIASSGDIYTLAINQEGIIEANGIEEIDGQIILSSDTGTIQVTGELIAKNENKTGGKIHVLGEYVQLLDEANIDVSNDFSGGEVLIGGDYKGQNTDIKNSKYVVVEKNTHINASCLDNGNGGKVILWADDGNWFYGSILAESGPIYGDGGFVEVSSHGIFEPRGSVSTLAPNGHNGTLLFDPVNITISIGACATSAPPYPTSGNDYEPSAFLSAILTVDDLVGSTCGAGTGLSNNDVTIDSTFVGTEQGDITLASSFSWNNSNKLTLISSRTITINPGVTISNTGGANVDVMDFTANASYGASNYFGIYVQGTLSTSAGNIILKGIGGDTGANNDGIRISSGSLTTTTGNIFLTGTGGNSAASERNYGVHFLNSTITTGNILNVVGIAGTGTQRNFGIFIDTSTLESNGSSEIYLEGTGGSGTLNQNFGISNTGNSIIRANSTGRIKLKGTGNAAGSSNANFGLDLRGSILTTSGEINLIGDGATHATFGNLGINYAGGSISSTSGNVTLKGYAHGSSNSNQKGVFVNTTIDTSGNVDIEGVGSNGSANNFGVEILQNITVTAGGTIKIKGTGGGGANDCVGIKISVATVTTDSGSINLIGDNSLITATGDNNNGISISAGTAVTSTSGPISFIGKGAQGNNFNYGLFLTGGSITTTSSTIDLKGTGGTGSDRNIGINFGGTTVTSVSGNITSTGISLGTGAYCFGIHISGGTLNITETGYLTMTGTGGPGVNPLPERGQNGIFIEGGITQTNSGFISLTGTGGLGARQGNGIYMRGGTINSNSGDITLTGYGKTSSVTTGSNNKGIFLDAGTVTSTSGTLSINGTGATNALGQPSGSNFNYGIHIDSSLNPGTTGDIILTGIGGGGIATVPTTTNHGINISSGGSVIASAGSSSIVMTGTGGGNISSNFGINTSSATIQVTAGSSGNISMTGYGGFDTIGHGLSLNSSVIQVLGSSSISIKGFGIMPNITYPNAWGSGVEILDTGISTITGDITIQGQGNGSSFGSGIDISKTTDSGFITSTSGKITIIGNASTEVGVSGKGTSIGVPVTSINNDIEITGIGPIDGTGIGLIIDTSGGGAIPTQIISTSGFLTLSGIAGGNRDGIQINTTASPSINTTSTTSEITLTAQSDSGIGLNILSGSIGNATTNAPISISTDTISLVALNNIRTNGANGSVLIQPVNIATSIKLGDTGVGTLDLNSTTIERITTGALGLTIGRVDGAHDIIVKDLAPPTITFASLLVRGNNITFEDAINIGAATPLEVRIGQTGIGSFTFNNKTTFVASNLQVTGVGNPIENTFYGGDPTNTWNITSNNAGTFTNSVGFTASFSNVGNLIGSTVIDTFIFTSQAKLDGLIDGGIPPQINVMDFSDWDPPPIVVYTGPYDGLVSNLGIGFFNIGQIIYQDVLVDVLTLIGTQLELSLGFKLLDPSGQDTFNLFQMYLAKKVVKNPNMFWSEIFADVLYRTLPNGSTRYPVTNFQIFQPYLNQKGGMSYFFFPSP